MPTKRLRGAPCQQKVLEGDAVDLTKIPIMQCWPEDAAPLITWGSPSHAGRIKSVKMGYLPPAADWQE